MHLVKQLKAQIVKDSFNEFNKEIVGRRGSPGYFNYQKKEPSHSQRYIGYSTILL